MPRSIGVTDSETSRGAWSKGELVGVWDAYPIEGTAEELLSDAGGRRWCADLRKRSQRGGRERRSGVDRRRVFPG